MDFIKEHYVDRKNSNSSKWDNLLARFNDDRDLLAMWVADMDFKCAKAIRDALRKRLEHGVFGYSNVLSGYYESVISWMKDYHNASLEPAWIRFNNGVVNSIYHLINCFSAEGESVLIFSPVYYPFARSVRDNKRHLVECELLYENGVVNIDYSALESDIVRNQVKIAIFCSPHNPLSRIWDEAELRKCFELFKKHGVLIICDEIHQDFYYEKRFFSALRLNEFFDNLIILNSASKSFNLASLLHSHVIIPNETLRERYDEFAKRFNQVENNLFGMIATMSAYNKARDWLENVKKIIYENYLYIKNELADIKDIEFCPFEGTYLLFINFSKLINPKRMKEFIQDDCEIAIDYGEWFGKGYEGFIRLNLATAPSNVAQFVARVKHWLSKKDYR